MALNTPTPYRGLGIDVSACDTDQCIIDTGKLDWKVVPMDLAIVGNRETRAWADYKALVRSDNGYPMAPATKDYKPFQNHQIVHGMRQVGDAGSFQIQRIGQLDKGRRIWAVGTVPGHAFDLAGGQKHFNVSGPQVGAVGQPGHGMMKTDRTTLEVRMSSGHVPGTAFTLSFIAKRALCENGAELDVRLGTFKLAHRGEFGSAQLAAIRRFLGNAGVVFKQYEEQAKLLWATSADRAESMIYVAQLLQPKIFADMVERNLISEETRNFRPMGFHPGRLLDQIIGHHEQMEFVEQGINRAGARVLDLLTLQPGADAAPETMWNTYNAVTYFVDHERGRSEDSGLNAAMFGEGAQIKREALALAVEYANAHQGVGVN